MLKPKGFYEWKLVNKDSGEVEQEGSQWNLITDALLADVCSSLTWGLSSAFYYRYLSILISDTIPTPGVDYRRWGESNVFNILTSTGCPTVPSQGTNDYALGSKWVETPGGGFAPPVAPRTIRVIGIRASFYTYTYYPRGNFSSFIELSSPITQNTNQYLYVKYTIYLSYTSGGYNTPGNRYMDRGFNQTILLGSPLAFGYSNLDNLRLRVTCLNPPVTLNNMMRSVPYLSELYYIDILTPTSTQVGGVLANTLSKAYAVGDIPGPIGALCFNCNASPSATETCYTSFGYTPDKLSVPSISRVFIHPAARIAQIFSDPSYPPLSNGAITLSGTPTNKYPITGRIKITKTGDASDIVDETFLPAAINTGTEEITITQSFALNDIVRFTNSGGTLPTGISAGVDYYVIQAGTTIIISTSLGGSTIDISDQGTGTHTIIRQNTGRYALETEPWNPNYAALTSIVSTHNYNMNMGIDASNKVQPHNLYLSTDTGEGGTGGTSWWGDTLIRGYGKVGNYIFTVQRSRVDNLMNMCRWLFNSVETSISQCTFGNASTVVNKVETIGTDMYIGTNDGIYKYDTTLLSTSPALITVTGIIDTNINDLAYDTVTGFLWSGHDTGLSKINLGALTATQYTSAGTGLTGMTANQAKVLPGQLDVYNGRVLRAGAGQNITKWPLVNQESWVLDDGTGWYVFANWAQNCGHVAALRKGTTNVVLCRYDTLYLYNVLVTGLGTGSVSTVESFAISQVYYYGFMGQMAQLSDGLFVWVDYSQGAESTYTTHSYQIGIGIGNYLIRNPLGGAVFVNPSYHHFSQSRNIIDTDGNGNNMVFWCDVPITHPSGTPNLFGYTGGNWVKDSTAERNIPATGTQALLSGVSVAFNNAVGKPWDQQFVAIERYTFVYAPVRIKDNLQTTTLKARFYFCSAAVHSLKAFAVPGAAAYTHHVDESPSGSTPNVNFRNMDNQDFLTEVYEGATRYTVFTLPAASSFTVVAGTDILTVGVNIPSGTPIQIAPASGDSVGYVAWPLEPDAIYYAINVDTTRIKLATTYANAIGGIAIDITDIGSGTQYFRQVAPTTGTYYAGINGIFVFAAADTGKNLTLTYTYTLYT